MTKVATVEKDSGEFEVDFTTKRHDHSVIPVIIWTTVAFFVLSISSHWLFQIFGWQSMESLHEWMFTTFSVDPGKVASQPWLLVTHMFMHGGLIHFGMNMLVLYMFYKSAKEFFPGRTWLIIYFVAGIAGGLLYSLLNPAGAIMVGASGGIMGLWGAAIAARIRYKFVPEDERPWQCTMTLGVLLQYLVIQAVMESLIPNVAHSAHAGGMIAGFLVGLVLPLWQQPRLVSLSPEKFVLATAIIKVAGEYFVQKITVTPTEDFDPSRHFLAVEYDQVDGLGRRSYWLSPVVGNVPQNVDASQMAGMATSRTVGDKTAREVAEGALKEAAKAGVPLQESGAKKGSNISYGYLLTIFTFLILARLDIPAHTLTIMLVLGAVGTTLSWYSILREGSKMSNAAAALMAVALIGGATLGCYYFDFVETAALLMVSVTIGYFVPRLFLKK